jgi:hypothetical protein
VKKRLVLTTAVLAAAISASTAQAIGVVAGPPGGFAAQSGGEQVVPAAPPGGLAARFRAERAAVPAAQDEFDFADAAVGLGVGLGAALLLVGGVRARRSAPADA